MFRSHPKHYISFVIYQKCSYHLKEVLPRSYKKVFLPNPNRKRLKITPIPKPCTQEQKISSTRTNQLNIQMLSKPLYEQVFENIKPDSVNPKIVDSCQKILMKHEMHTDPNTYMKDVNFEIPPLKGQNIAEHFQTVGEEQAKPYRELIMSLWKERPEPPETWLFKPGWTRYIPGKPPESVDFPLEEALVFDVEVCAASGKIPTLATAVSDKAWYGWVSQSLTSGKTKPITSHHYSIDSLIPMESTTKQNGKKLEESMKKPKIIIGHNVSYDRARIKEQYWLNRTGTRFLDTMSLHICVSGLTSFQRAILKSGKQNDEDLDWINTSSLNSLAEVYKLYCNCKLEKETRNLFVQGSLSEIRHEFQTVMKYCSNDVIATHDVLKELFPLFLERFPHPVTLAGMLELSTAYLPINENWNRYIENSEQTYDDLEIESRVLLAKRADQACQLLHDEKYKEDLWMWDQDWTVKDLKLRKNVKLYSASNVDVDEDLDEKDQELQKKFGYLWDTKAYLSKLSVLLPGYPNWYRKLCTKPNSTPNWIPGPILISTSMQITPKLLSLSWEGYPLHFLAGNGWGFLVPFTDDLDTCRKLPLKQLLLKCLLMSDKPDQSMMTSTVDIDKIVQENLSKKEYYSRVKKDQTDGVYRGTGIWCNTQIEDCCYFFKLPHKNGPTNNVGNPLSRDFLNKFSDNVLAGDTESAERVLAIARMLSYWRNNRDRIMEQMVVWMDGEEDRHGAILPQIVICGTLTRRAVEPTWMTASNAHPERIGSELRAVVQAPPGYNIVGADVDSQELWIASVIGDAHHANMHGCTPFGWMTLSGSKSQGTDMHSVTAKAVGISRDHAKVINYARIYGAGQNFAERLLKQFNPSISDGEARSKAVKMFDLTKGKRIYYLKQEYLTDFPDQPYGKWQAMEMAKCHGKTVGDMFGRAQWVGGTESAMFNRLESIANDPEPKTPFLDGRLSRALEPKGSNERFLPTKVNWVVQSGAVDFLHLMLVCMRWIMQDKARFCLSFHDEIRYLVPENYRYQAALAMHLTNLLTRVFCSYKLGIKDLPQSVAFFSSVEVDTVLRKEAKLDCKTPSNPHGLEKGYNIPNGESLDIHQAIEKGCGKMSSWYERLRR